MALLRTFSTVICCLFTFFTASLASPLLHRQADGLPNAFQTQTISLPLDHFNGSDTRTFENRFWINDSWYKPGGPVFLFDVGETGVTKLDLGGWLAPSEGEDDAVVELAAHFGGLAIVWEHRFFGESQFFTPDVDTGVIPEGYDAYQYLTVEQALEDVVYFATHFNSSLTSLQPYLKTLNAGTTPWVMMGGSYPGVRSAVMRVRNPDVIYASWASSAPVQSFTDMTSFWKPLERVLPRNCSADINAAVKIMDQILTGNNQTAIDILKTSLWLAYHADKPGSWNESYINYAYDQVKGLSNFDMSQYIDSWNSGYQEEGLTQIIPFCDLLETFNPETELFYQENYVNFDNSFDGILTTKGIYATYGSGEVLYAFLAAIYEGHIILASETENATFIDNTQLFSSDDPSWAWIRLSEFGNYQPGNATDPLNVMSTLDSTQGSEALDAQILGFTPPSGSPNVSTFDQYGGWTMNPPNVMFTNGDWDGWMTRSVMADPSDGGPGRTTTQDIPACNVAPADQNVFDLVYPGAGHARDLSEFPNVLKGFNASDYPMETGLPLFINALEKWLPCFQNHTITSMAVPTNSSSSSKNLAGHSNAPTSLVLAAALLALTSIVL